MGSCRRTCAAERRSGRILLGSGVATAVLRAAVVIGESSASFGMLRHLTERLPPLVVPRWVDPRVQPIAIRDVLHYLVAAADLPPTSTAPSTSVAATSSPTPT